MAQKSRDISAANSCFIIAEAGVNHNGDMDLALQMIDIAAAAGANAVKFQTFNADRLVSLDAKTAAYQKSNAGYDSQYEMLKKLELDESDHFLLFNRCQERGIEFMSTPFDDESLDYLISLGMKKIKVGSGELTNIPFIKKIASKNLPTIISTGMSTIDEIAEAIEAFKKERLNLCFQEPLDQILTILHCTSNYPCPVKDANLKAMKTIYDSFGLSVGYSDHTLSTDLAFVAIGLGAKVYEKHFTLDKNLNGPDHAASLDPNELQQLVKNIKFAEECLGSNEKKPTLEELEVRKLVRKSIVMVSPMKSGQMITEKDVTFLRPGTGLSPKFMDEVIGKKLNKDVPKGYFLAKGDLS